MVTRPLRKSYFLSILIIPIIMIILPATISFADADRIFKENNKAVVVVVVYDQDSKPISQGSGFVVRADGAIVTNYHVINNAADIKVKAGDKILEVEGLLHTDKENDIVILKAKGEKLQTVKIGDIEKLNVGEKIYVISSPEGLENTITDGILSGIREIEPKRKILQITAPISSGSSGGPVFNKNGEVIGIATLLLKEAQNINFAMPVNLVRNKISAKKVIVLKNAEIVDYEKTAEYWSNLGFQYGEVGLNEKSIEAFKQAIRIKPDFEFAYFSLGWLYHLLGMYKEEMELFKQLLNIPHLSPLYESIAHLFIGAAYSQLGMYREAIESLKQSIKIIPFNVLAYNELGTTYRKIGMYKEAIESYRQAIGINSYSAASHLGLGLAYKELGMYKEAKEAFKQAIRINPDDAEEHYNLGVACGELGMYREAIDAYKQALRIKLDYAEAHFGLGLTYLILNDRGSALDEYKILKDLDPERANKLFNLIYK